MFAECTTISPTYVRLAPIMRYRTISPNYPISPIRTLVRLLRAFEKIFTDYGVSA